MLVDLRKQIFLIITSWHDENKVVYGMAKINVSRFPKWRRIRGVYLAIDDVVDDHTVKLENGETFTVPFETIDIHTKKLHTAPWWVTNTVHENAHFPACIYGESEEDEQQWE